MDFFFVSGDEAHVVKEEFCKYFQTNPSNIKDTQNANEDISLPITCKCQQVIIDIEHKALQDHYFNSEESKLL